MGYRLPDDRWLRSSASESAVTMGESTVDVLRHRPPRTSIAQTTMRRPEPRRDIDAQPPSFNFVARWWGLGGLGG